MKKIDVNDFPSSGQLKAEIKHEDYRGRYRRAFVSTVSLLIIVAAVAVLMAMLWVPVLEIFGASMTPTLDQNDIVLCVKTDTVQPGDLVAFYFGNKLLVKRCIAVPGDVVTIDDEGTVTVNDIALEEPYVSEKALGESDIVYPYVVPQERYFLLGDHRLTSVDSRSTTIGCIPSEQLVGRVFFRVWPLRKFGRIRFAK